MKFHHRHVVSPFEFEDRCQFHARERLEDEKQVVFRNMAILNVMIAVRAGEHDQAERADFLPEGFVVHRLKPFHDIVDVSEFHCKMSLAGCASRAQICSQCKEDA